MPVKLSDKSILFLNRDDFDFFIQLLRLVCVFLLFLIHSGTGLAVLEALDIVSHGALIWPGRLSHLRSRVRN